LKYTIKTRQNSTANALLRRVSISTLTSVLLASRQWRGGEIQLECALQSITNADNSHLEIKDADNSHLEIKDAVDSHLEIKDANNSHLGFQILKSVDLPCHVGKSHPV
jgi:hypothetical protein